MDDRTYSIIQLGWISEYTYDDAASRAIARASETLEGLGWFKVTDLRGLIRDGEVAEYQVSLELGFRLLRDDELKKERPSSVLLSSTVEMPCCVLRPGTSILCVCVWRHCSPGWPRTVLISSACKRPKSRTTCFPYKSWPTWGTRRRSLARRPITAWRSCRAFR